MKKFNLLKISREIINPPYKDRDVYIGIVSLIILTLIPVTIFGVLNSRQPFSKAADPSTIALSPTSLNVNQGDNFSVEIFENSGTEPVNFVEADITFDPNKLEFVSIDNSGGAFSEEAEQTVSSGSIVIARFIAGGDPSLTGNKLVSIINFKAKSVPGATSVAFVNGTVLLSTNTNSNILTDSIGGSYTIIDPPPNVNITNPVNNSIVSDTVNVSATATDDLAVTKVEFLIGAQIVGTDTTASAGNVYRINLNTNTLSEGPKTLTAKAYDVSSTPANAPTDTRNITIDNQAPSTPTGLSATAVSGTRIDLSWNASSDTNGVTGYEVYRDSVKIDTVTGTSYNSTGLIPDTTYSFYVKAFDGQNNISSASNTDSDTTIGLGDINSDGVVNGFDLSILLNQWKQSNAISDINGDGITNGFDLSILLSSWG